jgi:hypothetical protein
MLRPPSSHKDAPRNDGVVLVSARGPAGEQVLLQDPRLSLSVDGLYAGLGLDPAWRRQRLRLRRRSPTIGAPERARLFV